MSSRTLSLGIYRGNFRKSPGNISPDGKVLRVVLWNGRVAKLWDSNLWVGDCSNLNIFESLRLLELSAKEWSARNKNAFIEGIHSPAPCWPVQPPDKEMSDVELELLNSHHLGHCGGYSGLHCLVQPSGEGFSATIYDVVPMPPRSEAEQSVINCSFSSPNIFLAASEIRSMVVGCARRRKIEKLSGFDDDAECWPVQFGENRYA